MIPLRDTIPARRTAWIVRLLLVANLGVFALEMLQGAQLETLIYRFGLVPADWTFRTASDLVHVPSLLITLFTAQFLHGSLLHVGSNMWYLWIFGDNVEDRLGHGRFLLLYLGSGAVASVAQLLVQPQSTVPMIGASGAIAGALGAYFLLFPFARITTLLPLVFVWETIEVPAFVFLGFWFFLQWLQGLVTIGQMASTGGVAWWAHVGGFISGLILVVSLRPRQRYF